jgi:hypothetical protein
MSAEVSYETKRIDHLGIVAGICDEVNLVRIVDQPTFRTKQTAILVINCPLCMTVFDQPSQTTLIATPISHFSPTVASPK